MLCPERVHSVQCLSRYWKIGVDNVLSLPIKEARRPEVETLPPELIWVELPEWGGEFGVDRSILVPKWTVNVGGSPAWQQTDWLYAAFWYLNGLAEREFENRNGPIHSYNYKLKGWNPHLWEYAWVNRIALFIRRWASVHFGKEELSLFGPLPTPEILITHDVDATKKTIAIRLKQASFNSFNVIRSLTKFEFKKAKDKLRLAIRFLFSKDNYWCFDRYMDLEKQFNVRSCFNFWSGKASDQKRAFKNWFFDPAYNVEDVELKSVIRQLVDGGWKLGLHQSYDSWADKYGMRKEREKLEEVSGQKISSCRQHWLRFSWERTWKAQQEAGLGLDMTLGFNDRPGFRNGAALKTVPWNFEDKKRLDISIVPTLFMDSHFYDYKNYSAEKRNTQIYKWLNEIFSVNGEASIIWHQRVLSADYQWWEGYHVVLQIITSAR